jgi:ferredoxin
VRAHVDSSRCQATGFCVRLASQYFTLDNSPTARALEVDVSDGDRDLLAEVEDLCPTRAITLRESNPK